MLVLVFGGRDYLDRATAFAVLDMLHQKAPIDVVIQGGAKGADRLGRDWAIEAGIWYAQVDAIWERDYKSAGPKRNRAMAKLKPDLGVMFPGGNGTDDMYWVLHKLGIPVYDAVQGKLC